MSVQIANSSSQGWIPSASTVKAWRLGTRDVGLTSQPRYGFHNCSSPRTPSLN